MNLSFTAACRSWNSRLLHMFNKTSKHCVAAEGAVYQSTGGPSQSDYRTVKVSHDSTDSHKV